MSNAATQLNAAYPAFARLVVPMPLVGMLNELNGLLACAWIEHVNRQDYSGQWDVLPLRGEKEHSEGHPVLQAFAIEAGANWCDLPILQNCPAFAQALRTIQCPLKSVRLMRLRAGANIKPHRDRGLCIEYGEARLHVPLITSRDVLFTVDGVALPMQAGELWYMNADKEHAVTNRGFDDRINLVIDCEANEWLRTRVLSADQLAVSCEERR